MAQEKEIKKEECPHIGELKIIQSEKTACEVCGITEHLRLCAACGKVFCCESHKAHNTEHYQESSHPIIKAHLTDYDFTWCYKCSAYLK